MICNANVKSDGETVLILAFTASIAHSENGLVNKKNIMNVDQRYEQNDILEKECNFFFFYISLVRIPIA